MLNQAQINELAAKYGFEPNSKLVIENAQQANEYHGQKCHNFDGDLKRFWTCDRTGHYNAYNMLDGYLSEESRFIDCDTKANRAFEAEYR